MDFLTGMAFWGILVLVAVNAILVSRMKIEIEADRAEGPGQERKSC